jgi:hypothetical protein
MWPESHDEDPTKEDPMRAFIDTCDDCPCGDECPCGGGCPCAG